MSFHRVITGDCLEVLRTLDAGSVDAVVTDAPYGTTEFRWDNPATGDAWWDDVLRVVGNGPIVMTSCGMFTADLMCRRRDLYRYKWVWHRGGKVTGFLDASSRPLRVHEDVLVFGRTLPDFYPQKWTGTREKATRGRASDIYGHHKTHRATYDTDQRFPIDFLHIQADDARVREHPTQKPVALMEYLIRSYVPEGGTVLDPFCGSGTTGVACKLTGRNFIGIEIDPTYANIARRRIADAASLFHQPAREPEPTLLGVQ